MDGYVQLGSDTLASYDERAAWVGGGWLRGLLWFHVDVSIAHLYHAVACLIFALSV